MLHCKTWRNSGNHTIKKKQQPKYTCICALALQIHLPFQALELLCRIRIKARTMMLTGKLKIGLQLLMEWALIERSNILCDVYYTHIFCSFASCGQVEFLHSSNLSWWGKVCKKKYASQLATGYFIFWKSILLTWSCQDVFFLALLKLFKFNLPFRCSAKIFPNLLWTR